MKAEMTKTKLYGMVTTVPLTAGDSVTATPNTAPQYGEVRLAGPLGARLDAMIKNHVQATDILYLTDVFKNKAAEVGTWRTEFWGKYMHAAMPFWSYTRCPALKAKIDAGLANLLSSQLPEGYIGDYSADTRCGEGWDVWGMKYTMLGLLHYYDATGDRKALDACRRLCDFVIGELGPGGTRPLHVTGNYGGMASCSILESVMWLYRRTQDAKYLKFADYIVHEMNDHKDGPQLIDLALQGVPVADRDREWLPVKQNRTKAYEMMSCYQGLLEYFEVTDDRRCLDAAVKSVENIVDEELNICGGCASGEHWYHGKRKQHLPFRRMQETCVTTTWMRICEKLLEITGDSKYADLIEQTFYNAYLAAMKSDCSEFIGYTPLNGVRFHGQHHCMMHIDCCNANGPRGFLVLLRGLLQANGNAAIMNFYASSRASVKLPASGETVTFETYTLYPRNNVVTVFNRTAKEQTFTLKLRIPAWCETATVKVNGKAVPGVCSGKYLELNRTWRHGDRIELAFAMPVKAHEMNHFVAFTCGPVVLARDARFNDGPTDDVFHPSDYAKNPPVFTPVRSDDPAIGMLFAAAVPTGSHHENPEGALPAAVRFCDYASAGDTWNASSAYRVWFPVEWSQEER